MARATEKIVADPEQFPLGSEKDQHGQRVLTALLNKSFDEVFVPQTYEELVDHLVHHMRQPGSSKGFMVWYFPEPDRADLSLPAHESFGVRFSLRQKSDSQLQALPLMVVPLSEYRTQALDMHWYEQPILTLLPTDIHPNILRPHV